MAAAAGAAVCYTARALKAGHARTVRVRSARARFRELVRELSECKRSASRFDSEVPPSAQEVGDAVRALASCDGGDANAAEAALDRATRLSGVYKLANEELTRLMETVDGVEPAQVLVAAGLEPWAEFEAKAREDAVSGGLGVVLDMAGHVRVARKGLIRALARRGAELERQAKKLDAGIAAHMRQAGRHADTASATQAP